MTVPAKFGADPPHYSIPVYKMYEYRIRYSKDSRFVLAKTIRQALGVLSKASHTFMDTLNLSNLNAVGDQKDPMGDTKLYMSKEIKKGIRQELYLVGKNTLMIVPNLHFLKPCGEPDEIMFLGNILIPREVFLKEYVGQEIKVSNLLSILEG